jgi:hypothetical protein
LHLGPHRLIRSRQGCAAWPVRAAQPVATPRHLNSAQVWRGCRCCACG